MVTIGKHTCLTIWELNPAPCNAADTLFEAKGFNSHVNIKITDNCCQLCHTDSKRKQIIWHAVSAIVQHDLQTLFNNLPPRVEACL